MKEVFKNERKVLPRALAAVRVNGHTACPVEILLSAIKSSITINVVG